MDYLLAVLLGLGAAAGAVLGPGMLNMTVVKTALRTGRKAAILFAAGIALTYTVQATAGTIGANFLRQHDDLLATLRELAIPVFFILAIVFFVRWYRRRQMDEEEAEEEDEEASDVPLVLQGASLALVNLLAIPYFFTIATWLMSDGYLSAKLLPKIVFVLAAVAGVFAILVGYAYQAEFIKRHARMLTKNIQLVLSGLFILLTGLQVWREWL